MSETVDLDSGAAEISSDGLTIQSGDSSVTLDFDELEQLTDFLGYVRKDEFDGIERDLRAASDVIQSLVDEPEDSDRHDVLAAVEELSENRGGLCVVNCHDGPTFVGRSGNTHQSNQNNQFGNVTDHALYLDVFSPDEIGAMKICYQSVYEPQTRDYPGYRGVEDVRVEEVSGPGLWEIDGIELFDGGGV